MATKLYVGNLSFRTTSEELREAFAAVGTVESASVIEDRETGRSRGFAFVEMATPEEAAAAIEAFNGKDFGGRNLTVNEAKPRTDRGRRWPWWLWWWTSVAVVVVTAAAVVAAVIAITIVTSVSHAGNQLLQITQITRMRRCHNPHRFICVICG